MPVQTRSNGARVPVPHPYRSIEVVNEEPRESENSQTPRCGELRTELPIGNRGRKDKAFVRALVAIYAKLIYTQIFGTRRDILNITPLRLAVNKVFNLAHDKIPAVTITNKKGEVGIPKDLGYEAFRRKCFQKDSKDKITKSFMQTHFEDMDGNDQWQMDTCRRLIEKLEAVDLFEWLQTVVLAELANPGSAVSFFENKVFTEFEKQILRADIDGIDGSYQEVEEETLTTAPAPISNVDTEMAICEVDVSAATALVPLDPTDWSYLASFFDEDGGDNSADWLVLALGFEGIFPENGVDPIDVSFFGDEMEIDQDSALLDPTEDLFSFDDEIPDYYNETTPVSVQQQQQQQQQGFISNKSTDTTAFGFEDMLADLVQDPSLFPLKAMNSMWK